MQTIYKYGLIVLGILSILYAVVCLVNGDFTGFLIELCYVAFVAAAWFVLKKYHDEEDHNGHKQPLV